MAREGVIILSTMGGDASEKSAAAGRLSGGSELSGAWRFRRCVGCGDDKEEVLEVYDFHDISRIVELGEGPILERSHGTFIWGGVYEDITVAEARVRNRSGRGATGLRVICMDVEIGREPDFNRWYDSEHVLDQLAIGGVRNGRRFVARYGGPKYLALYDLDSPSVAKSDAYLGREPTAWTRSMVSALSNWRRQTYEVRVDTY